MGFLNIAKQSYNLTDTSECYDPTPNSSYDPCCRKGAAYNRCCLLRNVSMVDDHVAGIFQDKIRLQCLNSVKMIPLLTTAFRLSLDEEPKYVMIKNSRLVIPKAIVDRIDVLDLCKWRVMNSSCVRDRDCTFSNQCENGKCKVNWKNLGADLLTCSTDLMVYYCLQGSTTIRSIEYGLQL